MSHDNLLDADVRARETAVHLETLKPDPRTTSTIVKVILFAIVVFAVALVVVWNAKYTVASGQKFDEFSQIKYGYRIERYYFWKTTRVSFWKSLSRSQSNGFDFVFESSAITVEKIVEERWINNHLAIYLNIDFTYHDSIKSTVPTKMIFDFHRGEMHTFSSLTLFRIWNDNTTAKKWLNEQEFQSILNRLDH